MSPFAQSTIVEHLEFVCNNEGHDTASQTLLKHHKTPHTTIAVLEGVNLLEADMKVENVLQCVLSLSVVTINESLHTVMNQFGLTRLLTTNLVGQTLIVAYGKPILAAIRRTRFQNAVKHLYQIFRKGLMGTVDNDVYTTEVVHCLYDIVHIDTIVSSHTNGVSLKDVASLIVRQTTTLYMIRIVGQVYLGFMIDIALHLHFFLLAKCCEQRCYCVHRHSVFRVSHAFCISSISMLASLFSCANSE